MCLACCPLKGTSVSNLSVNFREIKLIDLIRKLPLNLAIDQLQNLTMYHPLPLTVRQAIVAVESLSKSVIF